MQKKPEKKTIDTRQQVILRLDKKLVKTIDHLAVEAEEYRQQTIERLLRSAVQVERRQFKLEM